MTSSKTELEHLHHACDGCRCWPIIGNRWFCRDCRNFDFCTSCYEKRNELHDSKHEFVVSFAPWGDKPIGSIFDQFLGRETNDTLGDEVGKQLRLVASMHGLRLSPSLPAVGHTSDYVAFRVRVRLQRITGSDMYQICSFTQG